LPCSRAGSYLREVYPEAWCVCLCVFVFVCLFVCVCVCVVCVIDCDIVCSVSSSISDLQMRECMVAYVFVPNNLNTCPRPYTHTLSHTHTHTHTQATVVLNAGVAPSLMPLLVGAVRIHAPTYVCMQLSCNYRVWRRETRFTLQTCCCFCCCRCCLREFHPFNRVAEFQTTGVIINPIEL
jgi:hypothetical protein